MKQYDSYKDSGVEWIGEVPSHWEVRKIKTFSPVKRGASPRPIDDPKYFDENGEFSWVRIADVSASDKYLTTTTQKLSNLGSSLSVKRYPGDIFISIAGTVGKPIISSIKCCIHDGFVYFPYLKNMNTEFLYYIFMSGQPYLGLGKLGTQLNLNTETIGNIYIPYPSVEVQNLIVSYLNKKCSEIDNVISAQQKRIALLQELKQSVITHAVTKGLNPNVEMKDSGVEWIGKSPLSWKYCRLKDFLKLKTDVSESLVKIGLENIESKTGKFIETSTEFEGNGVAFSKRNIVYGKLRPYLQKVWLAEFDGNAVGDFFVFESKKNAIPTFIKYLMLSDGFTKEANGSTVGAKMPRVSSSFILTMHYCLPSIEEQQAIVEYLTKRCDSLDIALSKAQYQVELLQEYKQSLITEVVTGKRKVC